MIISASRRTDIPAYYWQWMVNRIKEGYVCVRNAYNAKQVSRICLHPHKIDCYVFWTKNLLPVLKNSEVLDTIPFYFQHTITGYGKDVERNLPDKEDIINGFVKIAEKYGKNHIIWRYDPVFINPTYSLAWHKYKFEEMACKLADNTVKCTVSFLDTYGHILPWMKESQSRCLTIEEQKELLAHMVQVADYYGIYIDTCAEKGNFPKVRHAHCIDKDLAEQVCGYTLDVDKDKTQRLECGCVSSIDIGYFSSCMNGCAYCYATHLAPNANHAQHDPASPLLIGNILPTDTVTNRKIKSLRGEIPLF